jgi:hypothetical protein
MGPMRASSSMTAALPVGVDTLHDAGEPFDPQRIAAVVPSLAKG